MHGACFEEPSARLGVEPIQHESRHAVGVVLDVNWAVGVGVFESTLGP
jgi:hypothetical protein